MKKATILLILLAMSCVSVLIGVGPVSADHDAMVEVTPRYYKGGAETKTFNVTNLPESDDWIIEVTVDFPMLKTGEDPLNDYKPVSYSFPVDWKKEYQKAERRVVFTSLYPDDDEININPDSSGIFVIEFDKGPAIDGDYEWTVSTTDSKEIGHTYYVMQTIDTTPPTIEIIYPDEGQLVKGDIWINATAEDKPAGVDPSTVKLILNDEFVDFMGYDEEAEVYYWWNDTLSEGEGEYVAVVNATDKAGNEGSSSPRSFIWHFFRPWITITPKEGVVGTQVTVTGSNFLPESEVEIWWGGYTEERLDDDAKYYPPTWDGEWTWQIKTVGDDKLVATADADEKGDFETSFEAPESWGGYHPVWAEVDEEPTFQEQIFRILPSIEIDPSSGVSGQYVHLYGTGFSSWEWYQKWMDKEDTPDLYWDEDEEGYIYERDGTGFVLDFGPNQRYVDESHFVLNGEAEFEWLTGIYYPTRIDAMGTIIYYDSMHEVVGKIGSHFLQVPFLQPEDYDVTAYRFNMYETRRHYYYDTTAKKWDWKTEFKYEHDYSYTESASTVFTIESLTVEADISEILNRLDDLEATIIGVIEDSEGNILVAISALNQTIIVELDQIDAKLVSIQGDLAIINSIVGEIKVSVDVIEPKIVDIHDDWATVVTKVGTIEGKVIDIDWDDVAPIATIETDVGDLKARVPEDLEDRLPPPETATTLSLTAVLAAIAAIASCIAVVVLLRRLKVAA